MSAEVQVDEAVRVEAPTALDVGPSQAAFEALDPAVAKAAVQALGYALDISAETIGEALEGIRALGLGSELEGLIGRCLDSIAGEYEVARNTRELERTLLPDLTQAWLRGLAMAAEEISAQHAHRERQLRSVLALGANATEGRTAEQNALQLEVYNYDAKSLVEDEEAWSSFEAMLETRQLSSLQPDIGYNICVLPLDIGDPEASGRAAVENTANFLRKLASLGERLNIVFFVDVKPAGGDALAAHPLAATRGPAQHQALRDTLSFLSWDPKDNGRLGRKLASLFNGNDVSRYIVLNGGVGLLAARKLDGDLAEEDVQHGVLISPSAVSAGLTAWSVAGEGAPVIAGGSSPGTGGVVGIEAVACVALREHQELARRAGINSVFIPELSAVGSVDTSMTLARADEKLNQDLGQCSVEAILLSQYINRMGAGLVRRLTKNDVHTRDQQIVGPLRRELAELKAKGVLRDFEVTDKDLHDQLAAQSNAIDIQISFQEVGKLERATITVSRATGEAPGKD